MDYSEKSRTELTAELAKVNKELEATKKTLQKEKKDKMELEFLVAERKKKLICHNLISQIFSLRNLSQNQVLLEILEAIPPSFQFPEIAQALIEIGKNVYKTPGYQPTVVELKEPVFASGEKIGRIVVGYVAGKYEPGEKIFLKEESDLLKSIAERIGNYFLEKAVEEKVADNKLLNKTFIDSLPELITITDLEGNILSSSSKVAATFGYASDTNFVHRNFVEFIDEQYHSKAARIINDMFEGHVEGAEKYMGIKADGTRFKIELNVDFIRDSEGNPLKMIFITRDISEREKVETD